MKTRIFPATLGLLFLSVLPLKCQEHRPTYHWQEVDSVGIFYRKAGNPEHPVLVLLHGTPSSSVMYQELMELLLDDFYLIAPDYPAHGYSDSPPASTYRYTFENISMTIRQLLSLLGIEKYSLYMQDYGAPVGFRMAVAAPQKIDRLIIQNANAYLEGFPQAQDNQGVLQTYWRTRDAQYEKDWVGFYSSLQPATAGKWRHGPKVNPDRRALDIAVMQRPGTLALFQELWFDYGNNVKDYPKWQEYLRENQPPALVLWGKEDVFFTIPGAVAYLNDLPRAEVHLLNGGHWLATDDNPIMVAGLITAFFKENP